MSARSDVVNAIKPLFPKRWRVVSYLTDPGTISDVTVMVHVSGIEKFPAAPLGYYKVNFEVTVYNPSKDAARVWDELDDEVLEVVAALDTIEDLDWTGAEPLVVNNIFCWNISLSVPTQITKE